MGADLYLLGTDWVRQQEQKRKPPLRLYLLYNPEFNYDENDHILVIAESEDDARQLAAMAVANAVENEGWFSFKYEAHQSDNWLKSEVVEVRELPLDRGIVYAAFHPG